MIVRRRLSVVRVTTIHDCAKGRRRRKDGLGRTKKSKRLPDYMRQDGGKKMLKRKEAQQEVGYTHDMGCSPICSPAYRLLPGEST